MGKISFFSKFKKNNMEEDINEYDYLIDANEELKPLIISFGGISGQIYQPVFEFKRFLQNNVNCHFIFIKDTNQSWYHNGAIGLGESIIELKLNLLKIIKKINY